LHEVKGLVKAVIRPQLARLAARAGLRLERFSTGTVRFTLPGYEPPADVTPGWFRRRGRVTGPVYLVGREKSPPLADVNGVAGKRAWARFPLLVRHRVVSLDGGGAEVSAVVAARSVR
jgi:hypothetical protein